MMDTDPRYGIDERDDDAYEALDLERGCHLEDPYRHAPPDSPYSDA